MRVGMQVVVEQTNMRRKMQAKVYIGKCYNSFNQAKGQRGSKKVPNISVPYKCPKIGDMCMINTGRS